MVEAWRCSHCGEPLPEGDRVPGARIRCTRCGRSFTLTARKAGPTTAAGNPPKAAHPPQAAANALGSGEKSLEAAGAPLGEARDGVPLGNARDGAPLGEARDAVAAESVSAGSDAAVPALGASDDPVLSRYRRRGRLMAENRFGRRATGIWIGGFVGGLAAALVTLFVGWNWWVNRGAAGAADPSPAGPPRGNPQAPPPLHWSPHQPVVAKTLIQAREGVVKIEVPVEGGT
ncbi:MAG: hypothetical protein GYA33_07525, partial [Thermogutta sp.]|nr:hypothetical protein [Thermogutta sp.]